MHYSCLSSLIFPLLYPFPSISLFLLLSPATLAITKHETKGESPPKRGGHCAFVSNNRMFVFGGYDGKKYYNDLYCLALGMCSSFPRSHTNYLPIATIYSPLLTPLCARVTHSPFLFFLDTFIWSKVEAKGNLPKPRSGHTATLINDGAHLLVFGGCGANSDFFSDVHILQLSDMTWEQPKCVVRGSEGDEVGGVTSDAQKNIGKESQ